MGSRSHPSRSLRRAMPGAPRLDSETWDQGMRFHFSLISIYALPPSVILSRNAAKNPGDAPLLKRRPKFLPPCP
ncbi:hypothetical protein ACP_1584 [Acidobacterium capsulatum ATCC 51196]|uniref:Uncharacterized protein n=1 Tax=Acidobacterium capsulatum (strain ATCC 51196 / DSM 11244 / BCRC 80197 / JCM 7670 / NBRC 15755 / NCIMB 13165 / 161) TaxID=240015 RepID=C1F6S6_ACIC5|nr:hypothetical protein ACP_1584 [Acidobacterium capsulatum ATCC 51196]